MGTGGRACGRLGCSTCLPAALPGLPARRSKVRVAAYAPNLTYTCFYAASSTQCAAFPPQDINSAGPCPAPSPMACTLKRTRPVRLHLVERPLQRILLGGVLGHLLNGGQQLLLAQAQLQRAAEREARVGAHGGARGGADTLPVAVAQARVAQRSDERQVLLEGLNLGAHLLGGWAVGGGRAGGGGEWVQFGRGGNDSEGLGAERRGVRGAVAVAVGPSPGCTAERLSRPLPNRSLVPPPLPSPPPPPSSPAPPPQRGPCRPPAAAPAWPSRATSGRRLPPRPRRQCR